MKYVPMFLCSLAVALAAASAEDPPAIDTARGDVMIAKYFEQ